MDRLTADKMNDEGARRLAAVIVAGIVREYKAVLECGRDHEWTNDSRAREIRRDKAYLEELITSDYFEILADTDGPSLIKKIRELVDRDAPKY